MLKGNIQIHDLLNDNINKLISILFDAYQDHPEYGEPTEKDARKYINWLKRHSTLFKIVYDKECPIAFLVVDTNWIDKFDKKNVGEIHELAIKKDYWGKNIGSMLLDLAFKHIKEKGLSTARLWVGEKNKEAIKFYEKKGFYPIFQGWGWIRMEKKL
ncbi:MAG TPA: GNAT family N-acetyltransferase [Persephonella sp.]|nr:GNAT family N-acetyltransferase [Persephonella sp.]